jgi:hypothetical protein
MSLMLQWRALAGAAALSLALSGAAIAQNGGTGGLGEGGHSGPGPVEQGATKDAPTGGPAPGARTGSPATTGTVGSYTAERCRQIMANQSAYTANDLAACRNR